MAAMNPRLESLDALSGLNTALIIGLSTALWGIYTACPTPFWEDVRYQMGHAPVAATSANVQVYLVARGHIGSLTEPYVTHWHLGQHVSPKHHLGCAPKALQCPLGYH